MEENFNKVIAIDPDIPANTYVVTQISNKLSCSITPGESTSLATLANNALYKKMCQTARYRAERKIEEFNFFLPLGSVGNLNDYGRGGFGLRHILSIADHCQSILDYYKKNIKIKSDVDIIITFSKAILNTLSRLNLNDINENHALAWNHASGKFIFATRLPYKLGISNYVAIIFYPDGNNAFSICSLYPISAEKFLNIKNGKNPYKAVLPKIDTPIKKHTKPATPKTKSRKGSNPTINNNKTKIPTNILMKIPSNITSDDITKISQVSNKDSDDKQKSDSFKGKYSEIYKLLSETNFNSSEDKKINVTVTNELPKSTPNEIEESDVSATLAELNSRGFCKDSNANRVVNIPETILLELDTLIESQYQASAELLLKIEDYLNYFSQDLIAAAEVISTYFKSRNNFKHLDIEIIQQFVETFLSEHCEKYRKWMADRDNIFHSKEKLKTQYYRITDLFLIKHVDFQNFLDEETVHKLLTIKNNTISVSDKHKNYDAMLLKFNTVISEIMDKCLHLSVRYLAECTKNKWNLWDHQSSASPYYGCFLLSAVFTKRPDFLFKDKLEKAASIKDMMEKLTKAQGFSIINDKTRRTAYEGPITSTGFKK